MPIHKSYNIASFLIIFIKIIQREYKQWLFRIEEIYLQ